MIDDSLKLYKVRFRLLVDKRLPCENTSSRLFFARNSDEALNKFKKYCSDRGYFVAEVSVKEITETEMNNIESLVPFYKEYDE